MSRRRIGGEVSGLASVVMTRNRTLKPGQDPEHQAHHSEGEKENPLTGQT